MSKEPVHEVRPDRPRWTHLALRVGDVEQSIAWYERFTPLRVLQRTSDGRGVGASLADPLDEPFPLILTLAQFAPETDPFGFAPPTVLGPFAHIGFELQSSDKVDAIAAVAEAEGTLTFPPTMMPPPIGYICFVEDPDGNTVEFSYDQGTYTMISEAREERS